MDPQHPYPLGFELGRIWYPNIYTPLELGMVSPIFWYSTLRRRGLCLLVIPVIRPNSKSNSSGVRDTSWVGYGIPASGTAVFLSLKNKKPVLLDLSLASCSGEQKDRQPRLHDRPDSHACWCCMVRVVVAYLVVQLGTGADRLRVLPSKLARGVHAYWPRPMGIGE